MVCYVHNVILYERQNQSNLACFMNLLHGVQRFH